MYHALLAEVEEFLHRLLDRLQSAMEVSMDNNPIGLSNSPEITLFSPLLTKKGVSF